MLRENIIGDKGQIIIDNKIYYYKRNDAYVEIFVEKIANFFNIKHAHYIPITYADKDYYLSEDLNNIGKFNTAYDLGIHTNNINEIINYVRNKYNDETIIKDLYKMHFMDIILSNIDRSNDNYGFLTKDNKSGT